MLLGTLISAALSAAGVTEDRVSRWLGGPCGCSERRAKLDALSAWAMRTVGGKAGRSAEWLERLMS